MRNQIEALIAASNGMRSALGNSGHFRTNNVAPQLHRAMTQSVMVLQCLDWVDVDEIVKQEVHSCIRQVQDHLTTVIGVTERGLTHNEEAALMALVEAAEKATSVLPTCDTHALNDPAVRQQVRALTDGRCSYCDCDLSDNWHIDHVVPKSAGGPDNIANYVPSCPTCNISKNGNHVLDFIKKSRGKVVQFRSEGAA